MLDLILIPILICLVSSFTIRKDTDDQPIFSRTQAAAEYSLFCGLRRDHLAPGSGVEMDLYKDLFPLIWI